MQKSEGTAPVSSNTQPSNEGARQNESRFVVPTKKNNKKVAAFINKQTAELIPFLSPHLANRACEAKAKAKGRSGEPGPKLLLVSHDLTFEPESKLATSKAHLRHSSPVRWRAKPKVVPPRQVLVNTPQSCRGYAYPLFKEYMPPWLR